MLLSAAFAMQSSAATMDMVKDGNFPAGTTAWRVLLDEDKTPSKPLQLQDGKVVLSADMDNWQHLKQDVNVKPETKYKFSITYNLTAGALRFDIPKEDGTLNEVSCDKYEKGVRAQYGTEQTFEYTMTTLADQTKFTLDIRNNCGDLGQAEGEILSVSLVELDAAGQPVEGTPEYPEQPTAGDSDSGDSPKTGVVFPVIALVAALTSAGAVAVSKKK